MYLLLGKYESNAIALKLSLEKNQEIIEDYESLVSILTKERGENTKRFFFVFFSPSILLYFV